MTTESTPANTEQKKHRVHYHRGGASDAVYGFGVIGAMIYYFTHAATFLIGVLGFFKALAWPAFLVFELLKYLNM